MNTRDSTFTSAAKRFQMPPSLKDYEEICKQCDEKSKISHRVILLDGAPKYVGLWGRFVHFLKGLGHPSSVAKKNNEAVRAHFRQAIAIRYSDPSALWALKEMNSQHRDKSSLRVKDVRQILKNVEKQHARKYTYF